MAEGSRILIVDDEAGIRQVVKTNLVMQGHDILEAKNGDQCLDVLADDQVDLVILDVMMPGTNGWTVLEYMRDQPELSGIPVMLLTAVSTEESKVKGFELGAADYLVKPFAVGELLARVQRLLSERHEREALAEFSITDWVTGLFNRRYLELRLAQEVSRSLRYKSPLAAVFFDIDDLSAIDSHEGPQLIDAILGKTATVLRGQIRACDLVFRYEGDYFFVLLPDTDGSGGFELAERLRRTIAKQEWPDDLHLTASFGVVELGQGETPDGFITRSEEALANAKEMGGNATWSSFALGGGVSPSATVKSGAAVAGSQHAPEPPPADSNPPDGADVQPQASETAGESAAEEQIPEPPEVPVTETVPSSEVAAPESPSIDLPWATEAPAATEPAQPLAPPTVAPSPSAATQIIDSSGLTDLRHQDSGPPDVPAPQPPTPPAAPATAPVPPDKPVSPAAPAAPAPPAAAPASPAEPAATPQIPAAPAPPAAVPVPAEPAESPQVPTTPQVPATPPAAPVPAEPSAAPAPPAAPVSTASGWGTAAGPTPPDTQNVGGQSPSQPAIPESVRPVAESPPQPVGAAPQPVGELPRPPSQGGAAPSSWADAQMMAAEHFTTDRQPADASPSGDPQIPEPPNQDQSPAQH